MLPTNKYCVSSEQLTKAIKGEMEAKLYYERLLTKTSDPEFKKIIRGITSDEEKHQLAFRKLYKELYGTEPVIPPLAPGVPIVNFFQGLSNAVKDELDAYEFYRDVMVECSDSKRISKVFFVPMTDENEHAALENYMMNKLNHR